MKFSKYLLLSTTVLGLANPLIALASDKTNQVKNTEQSAQTKASNKNDNKKVSEITNNNLKKATTNKLPIDYGQTNNLSTRVDNSDLDVSTGWNVTEFISDYHSDVNEIFVQGYADTILNQKYASIQVGGEGDTVFTAKKVLKLQKGHTYNFDIIYAQAQSTSGNSGKASGYIDFNGDRIESTDDGSNKHYTKTIAPSADMDFIITVHLETFYPDNIYWKVGYDLDKGGVVDDTVGADVTAKYVDTAGNKIAEDVVKSGTLGEDYSTDQLDIPGYTFKEVQGNPTGKFTDTAQTVTYVYTKDPVKAADVTAKYVDTDGNKIAEDVVKSGNVGDDYSTDQLKIKGYTFKEVQGNPTGKFTDTAQTVTYVYTKDPVKAADVTAKYVDTDGNKIAEDVVKSGNVGDDYSTDQLKIKGYTFKEVQGNPTGKFTDTAQTVTYVYTKDPVKAADVTAKYVDTAGNKIAEDVVKSGNVGDDYSTDQLKINGYTFKEVQGNPTGKFTDTAQTVTYVYTKDPVKAADVTVKYVDTAGNKIAEDVVKSGNVGDDYKTDQLSIPGYTFREVQGNVTGKFTNTAQTVTYVYNKVGTNTPSKPVANGNVTVRYVDESNSEIAKAEVITGKAGTAYKTEKKDIDGYIFKEVQGAVSGKITAFGQTVTYVYQKEKASNPGTNMPTKPVNPKTNTPTVPVVDNNNDNGSNSGNSNNNGNSDSNSTTNNETNNIVKNVVENVQTVLPKTAAEKVTWTEIVSLVLASLAGLIVWKKRK